MMTSEKLFVVLERSSVELLEEGLRFWSCPLAGRAGLEGTGGGVRWLLAVEEEGGRSASLQGITRAGEARTESDLDPGGVTAGGSEGSEGGGLRAPAGDDDV